MLLIRLLYLQNRVSITYFPCFVKCKMNYKYSLESWWLNSYIHYPMSNQLLVELSNGRQRNIYSGNVTDIIISPDLKRESNKIILRQNISGAFYNSESLEQIELSEDTNVTSIIDWWRENELHNIL